jgi:hypothetical protein
MLCNPFLARREAAMVSHLQHKVGKNITYQVLMPRAAENARIAGANMERYYKLAEND